MSPQAERVPASEARLEQKKQPEKKIEVSPAEIIELAAYVVKKIKKEAQTTSAGNSNKGIESVRSLGGGQQEIAELAKLEEPVKLKIEDLARAAALKLQEVVGLDKKTIEVTQPGKILDEKESKFKKILKAELKLFTFTPLGMPLRPAIRLFTEKDFRDYVLKKAPELAPVLAKAIATEGASLTNPKDIKILVDFAINDPKSPDWLKKWANKLLASKEGNELIDKASSKLAKNIEKK